MSVSVGYIWVGAERQQTDWKFYWLGKKLSVSVRYIIMFLWGTYGPERRGSKQTGNSTGWGIIFFVCFDAVHIGRS